MKLSIIIFTFFLSFILAFDYGASAHDTALPVYHCMMAVADGNFAQCANQLARQIYHLHSWSKKKQDITCGFPCTHNLKGRFSKWEWQWDAQFRCDSKAPGIVGEASRKSRDGAKEWAIKDFVQKAIDAGHIKAEDVKC